MFDWDDNKRRSNREKHGVDFSAVESCDWSLALVVEDIRRDYGEQRFVAFVPLDERLHVVVYAERGAVRRLISVRKANSRELSFYETQIDPTD